MKLKLYKDTIHKLYAEAGSKTTAWGLIRNYCKENNLPVPTMDKIELIKEKPKRRPKQILTAIPEKADDLSTEEIENQKRINDFEYICLEIEKGVATRNAVKAFMSSKTFYKLIDDNPDLGKRYARACEARAESMFEDIVEIADNRGGDTFINDQGIEMVDHAVIQRDRLRVDARKWMLGKMNPKKYGDKMDLTSDGEKINTVTFFELPKNGRDEGK